MANKWLIISNRLPFNYDANENKMTPSSGGLVTAIKGIETDKEMFWVGALTDDIPSDIVESVKNYDDSMKYVPIVLEQDLYKSYYNDFSNDVLWPLFHYESEIVRFRPDAWEDYVKVNRIFADKILETATDSDLVWVHDFHLFLVPSMIKERNPNLKVGFFLHIPFPTSEIYRQLPVRKEILESLLTCDLVGFHDYSYLRHFSSSVHNILGVDHSLLGIDYNDHHVELGVHPVSINSYDFISMAEAPETDACANEFKLNEKKQKIILGVDRLDYTKGVELKLLAFKRLLEKRPDLVGLVKFLQIAVPSRTDVPEYKRLKDYIDRLVGDINGRFSSPNYIPVQYIFNSVKPHELMALYRNSDVLFIGSKRDGMNLVALEYIVTQREKDPGVVVLSEFVGATSTLSHVLRVNPWDLEKTAVRLSQDLDMPVEERVKRHTPMNKFLRSYTATHWAKSFMDKLEESCNDEVCSKSISLIKPESYKAIQDRIQDRHVVFILDYDGTMVPIVDSPEKALLTEEEQRVFNSIAKREDNEIAIVSGRPTNFFKYLHNADFSFAAEHGARFFNSREGDWITLVNSDKSKWYDQTLQILEDYTIRTPDSFIEKKEFSISWHYRNSPPSFGKFQARKLSHDLRGGSGLYSVTQIDEKKVVEVRSVEANKGFFVNWLMEQYKDKENVIFVGIGSDQTDEDMFRALGDRGVSIKIGHGQTEAQYRLRRQDELLNFLKFLT